MTSFFSSFISFAHADTQESAETQEAQETTEPASSQQEEENPEPEDVSIILVAFPIRHRSLKGTPHYSRRMQKLFKMCRVSKAF